LYHSRTISDQDIAISGMVAAPDGQPPAGGFPLITMAHGTLGINRLCAPSIDPADGSLRDHPFFDMLQPYVDAGYAVAVTDYQGLGTPGVPAYLLGVSEGRNVLDAARAARALPGLRLAEHTLIWGHSQGGHGAAFAGEIAADYAPDQQIAGVALLAPGAELEIMALGMALVEKPMLGVGFLVMAAYSWSLNYPGAELTQVLTPAGMATLDTLRTTIGPATYAPFEAGPPHEFFSPLGLALHHTWRTIVAENVPGKQRTAAPIFVAQGLADRIIPPMMTRLFVRRLTHIGNSVKFTTYPETDHLGLMGTASADVATWMHQQLASAAPAAR
ncbi:MAG: lipase family protein, partial [Dehalococcoidia bacterium]